MQTSVQAFLITDALYHEIKFLENTNIKQVNVETRYWSQFQDISFNCGNNLPDRYLSLDIKGFNK